jgi:hypothetical protein
MEKAQTKIPHIAVVYSDKAPQQFFDDFQNEVAAENLDLALTPREMPKFYAALEWLIPTVVFVFVTKSYFEGFLGEAGKDHYHVLKRALVKLAGKMAQVKVTLFGTPGKISKEQKYSLAYSIMGQLDQRKTIKLLIQNELTEKEVDEAIGAFLAFLEKVYLDELDVTTRKSLESSTAWGSTLLVAFNLETKQLDIIDPRPH